MRHGLWSSAATAALASVLTGCGAAGPNKTDQMLDGLAESGRRQSEKLAEIENGLRDLGRQGKEQFETGRDELAAANTRLRTAELTLRERERDLALAQQSLKTREDEAAGLSAKVASL